MSRSDDTYVVHGQNDLVVVFVVNDETRGLGAKEGRKYADSPGFSELDRSLSKVTGRTVTNEETIWAAQQHRMSGHIPKSKKFTLFKNFMVLNERGNYPRDDDEEIQYHYNRFFGVNDEPFAQIKVTI